MRPILLCLEGVILACLLVVVGGSARAGGSWLEWDRFAYAPGETVSGTASFGNGCCNRGDPSDGPFHLYLRRFTGWNESPEVPPLPHDVIPLNSSLQISDGGTPWVASASFTVPEVAPGEYQVIHCNDPCTKLVGDLLIVNLNVVADDGENLLARRMDRLRTRLTAGLYRANNRFVTKARLDIFEDAVDRRLDAMEARISRLQTTASQRPSDQDVRVLRGGLGAGVVLTAAATAWWAVRRRKDHSE